MPIVAALSLLTACNERTEGLEGQTTAAATAPAVAPTTSLSQSPGMGPGTTAPPSPPSPTGPTGPSTEPTAADLPTTTDAAPPPIDSLPPTLPKDNSVHPANYAKCSGNVDASDSGEATLVGTPLVVPGYENRPTLLQDAAGLDAPLVVLFHGQNGCIANLQGRTDLDSIANARGVNLLWLSGEPLPTRSWRVNDRCCEPASTKHADDFGYLDAVFTLVAQRGLHPRRVISAGVSNGAGMALTVACRRPRYFDGAISVAGWLPITCKPHKPMSVLAFGGTKDEIFAPSTPRSITSVWRTTVTECPDAPEVVRDTLRQITTWRQCRDNTIVRLAVLPGVPHVWPKYTFYDVDEEIITFALGTI